MEELNSLNITCDKAAERKVTSFCLYNIYSNITDHNVKQFLGRT